MSVLWLSSTADHLRALSAEVNHPAVKRVGQLSQALTLLACQEFGAIFIEDQGINCTVQALHIIKEQHPQIYIVVISDHIKVEVAIECMRAGANDCLTVPSQYQEILAYLERFKNFHRQELNQPIFISSKMRNISKIACRIAPSDASVLLLGESGTGKEVFARFIHQNSHRADKPFIAINCAAIPETMLESTLFGYEKGAFTGAYHASPGKFELAQFGTIFLDEIAELPLNLQAKLLRVLQEKEVERLGAKQIIHLNVRIIAASKNLLNAMQTNRFREDLYYRLNVISLELPPLRQRPDEILPLAEKFIAYYAQAYQKKILSLDDDAKDYLTHLNWPGNVRELQNVIHSTVVLKASDTPISRADFCINGMVGE